PIVLLRRTTAGREALAPSVAPGNPYLGIMLPYTPLHHLLLAELGFPVVATSGNRSEEPICIDEREALVRLRDLADLFLVHNRPIARYCDDSVVRFIDGHPVFLRRARGYAPLPVELADDWPAHPEQVLAVGGHLKNTVHWLRAGRSGSASTSATWRRPKPARPSCA
ncbi:Sua5/YciO/YrdC/YwlC family protein, partial [Rhodothermus marinus]|uniref:Sua5/YciO/YrdC/YwlC family protein n=1 Tax=Rhodothermus marinus TaxID=29549 RepID=UPI000B02BD6E